MAIPTYQECMLPILKLLADGKQHTLQEFQQEVIKSFDITPVEQSEMLPSGVMPTYKSRVGWARTYLKKAGLIVSPKRATFEITADGKAALAQSPTMIDIEFLSQYPQFVAFFKTTKLDSNSMVPVVTDLPNSPDEMLEQAFQVKRKELASDLLEKILSCSPEFFERLVVDLLLAMGYGNSREGAGLRTGKTGDEGIDGIINEDRLGLDKIHVQAKRWQGTVGRPEIQKFVGALQGKWARKGVFITTSSFTTEATKYVEHIDTKVVLVDGEMLANLMIDCNVGVTVEETYVIKKIDLDRFEDV